METSGAFARFDTHQVGARPRAVAPDCKRQPRLAHPPVSRAPISIGLFAARHPLSNGLWPYEQQPEKRCPAAFSDRAEASGDQGIAGDRQQQS